MGESCEGESGVALTSELLIRAYCMGAFPMADGRDGEIGWYSPDPRAVLPIDEDGFRVPRSLRRRVSSGCYHITKNRAFGEVIRACALPRKDDNDTWINPQIVDVYCELHAAGLAHSVEAWAHGSAPGMLTGNTPVFNQASPAAGSDQYQTDNMELVGGLYGVALGGAFFGESMFHRATDASKVCLVALVEHLRRQGFELLDVQFVNPHLEQFGVMELSREAYMRRLGGALQLGTRW